MLIGREQFQNAGDRRGRAGGVDGAKHKVTCLGCVHARHEGLFIPHLAYEHHVRIFTHCLLDTNLEIPDILTNFALIDQALVFREDEFDRVFERENVLAIIVIDPVEHRRDRRAFP